MSYNLPVGKKYLGIELGSTRIKALLIDQKHNPIASGSFTWENRLENGFWTYSLNDVYKGLQAAYQNLTIEFKNNYNQEITTLDGIGISAMMHGYLPFDENGNQLSAFRTWRNTTTGQAAKILTNELHFNIPERWSIAHLYQAVLNDEEHLKDIDFLTTLAGYVHWKLTGEKVLGIGDASGMFPISGTSYNTQMLSQFDNLVKDKNFGWKVENILPKVLSAGEYAGSLTQAGALLLDPTGSLKAGIKFCPPEGDAGTGMVATNSITKRTGNVSAGTSIFAMIVLDKELKGVYPEIDIVTTPAGAPVAMVHCNNCTSDIDAFVKLFGEALEIFGAKVDKPTLYDGLYYESKNADLDCGGLISYNYYSGEQISGVVEGMPLFVRMPESKFTLANFMKNLLFSSVATLKIGMDILFDKENVKLERISAHGGLFKTKGVGQNVVAAALNTPVTLSETAGEGGAWGIAILAAYMSNSDKGLIEYLSESVFAEAQSVTVQPNKEDVQSFELYMERYKAGLCIEREASDCLKSIRNNKK
jgi:sugar (pentulose or hexulose) kinase